MLVATYPAGKVRASFPFLHQDSLQYFMPTFSSHRFRKPSQLHVLLKKHPSLFGIPFLLIVVGSSFGLEAFTQTRYDLHKQRVTQVRSDHLRIV